MNDPQSPPRSRLAVASGIALLAASLVLVTVVLPAEFGRDPTGFGRLTGLSRLSLSATPALPAGAAAAAATEGTGALAGPFQAQGAAPRTDEFVIPLEFADELEFKVQMKQGDTLVYSLQVEGAKSGEDAYADFHGEWAGTETEQVIEYSQATGLASNGALRAPMTGRHGWFLQNRGDDRITVRLKLSGFYELIPPGALGNERSILPQR
jgi:hypothetical protein